MARAVTHIFGLMAALAAAGCGDHQFSVQYAPEFSRTDVRTVSVFGVFRDGRISPEAWDQLGPRLSSPFSARVCESAYTEQLVAAEPALSSAVDDYARANGVTDDLLDQFSPMAKGDAILLVTVAGRPPQPIASTGGGPQHQQPTMAGMGRRGGGMGGGARVEPTMGPTTDRNSFEVSALLFSTRLHHTVAVVAMTYTGKSVDEAFASFAAKLNTELHGMTCTGWKPDVHVDDQRIREAISR